MGHYIVAALLLFHRSNSQILIRNYKMLLHFFNGFIGDGETKFLLCFCEPQPKLPPGSAAGAAKNQYEYLQTLREWIMRVKYEVILERGRQRKAWLPGRENGFHLRRGIARS